MTRYNKQISIFFLVWWILGAGERTPVGLCFPPTPLPPSGERSLDFRATWKPIAMASRPDCRLGRGLVLITCPAWNHASMSRTPGASTRAGTRGRGACVLGSVRGKHPQEIPCMVPRLNLLAIYTTYPGRFIRRVNEQIKWIRGAVGSEGATSQACHLPTQASGWGLPPRVPPCRRDVQLLRRTASCCL